MVPSASRPRRIRLFTSPSLYLMDAYQDPHRSAWLRAAYAGAAKRLDIGKSCVRFTTLADLPLDVVGEFIGGRSVADFICAA